MNNLLIFFAIPVAVIIFSIVLRKLLKCPILVASTIFAILLLIAFTNFTTTFLVAVIIYTILSFIVAYLTMIIQKILRNLQNHNMCGCCQRNLDNMVNNTNNQDVLTINANIETLGNNSNNDLNNGCGCDNDNNVITASANVIPNSSNNGRTGSFNGCYRRR